jgi:hypothetical protein
VIRDEVLEHRFVDAFPERLTPGMLYVSLEYGSAAHSCCCGCGEEVVTPITPTDWNITYDGETVTLHPSVGSWTLPCRSHYVIRRGRVSEALSWTDSEIAAERRRDRRAKAEPVEPAVQPAPPPVGGWLQRLRARWRGTGP